MIKLCAARLKPGGILVIETPNPECLAIFATHFYIDPTHTKPIPPALLAFYFEEFGSGAIRNASTFSGGRIDAGGRHNFLKMCRRNFSAVWITRSPDAKL